MGGCGSDPSTVERLRVAGDARHDRSSRFQGHPSLGGPSRSDDEEAIRMAISRWCSEVADEVEIEITVPDLRAVGGIVLERWVDENGCPTERRLLAGGIEAVCHEDAMPESDQTIVDGIPCTTALRTVIDLAAGVDPIHLERMVRDALKRRLFTVDEAAARVSQPDIAGRPGARLLGELLRRREGDLVT